MEELAKQAVVLSCGQMIDFTAKEIGSDDLLRYVSDRSCQLKRLQLECCQSITDEGVSEMVKKLPLLEELHLYRVPISKQAIEVVGRCCPHLKSFKFSKQDYKCSRHWYDEEALAIAQNMPELRHLEFRDNRITSDSLLAILENCLHLESLDLRGCLKSSNLKPDLARRLFQQMKDLKLSYAYNEFREFGFDYFDEEDYDDTTMNLRHLMVMMKMHL